MVWVVGIGIFLFLLFIFPRYVLSLVGIILILAAIVGSYFWVSEKLKSNNIAMIIPTVRYDEKLCSDPKWPIYISFYNGSNKSIHKMWFTLKGYRPGHSDTIASVDHSDDTIVLAEQTKHGCWSNRETYQPANNASQLQWETEITGVTFE